MRAEEMIVVDAAIAFHYARENRDDDQIRESRAALIAATQSLIYSCPECNGGGHVCPGCGESIGHFQGACPRCEDDSTSAVAKGEDTLPTTATHPCIECMTDLEEWEPATFSECLAGDRIRLNGEETTVIQSTRGEWHADTTDTYRPRPWTHEELQLKLEANPQLIPYPPEMAIEILCTPARRGALVIQKVFPGSTEVTS